MSENEFRLNEQQRQRVEEFRSRHKTGVLTLLFSDMVGSTDLKQQLGDTTGTALIGEQQRIVRDLLVGFPDGEEISTAGDSFFLAFTRPSDAVRFSLQLQSHLREESHQHPKPIVLRIGIHMGEVFIDSKDNSTGIRDLLGIQVDTAARIMGLARGGQVLLSRSVFDNARSILHGTEVGSLKPITWLNHGPYRVKGVDDPIEICEVGEEGLAPLEPPSDSEKAFRYISPDHEPVLGWRPALDLEIPTAAGWVLIEKLGEG
ncbi:MAG: hypothetical protein KC964_28160, partial [Candidatus Omnitrophica bacterium]|nr:hypothetical protein [Candidatus Omnitrophota bacterium]